MSKLGSTAKEVGTPELRWNNKCENTCTCWCQDKQRTGSNDAAGGPTEETAANIAREYHVEAARSNEEITTPRTASEHFH